MQYIITALLTLVVSLGIWQLEVSSAAVTRLDDRTHENRERIARLEEAVKSIEQMKADIRAIRVTVDEQRQAGRRK